MYKTSLMATALIAFSLSAPIAASERPDHFEGKPAETLKQAVTNFSETNEKLGALLSADELDSKALHEVHQLTYTLENALERIREDLDELAEVLEEVHVASETTDAETVKARGIEYLDSARQLID